MNDIELTPETRVEIAEQLTLSLAVLAVGAAVGIIVFAAQIQPTMCANTNTIFVQCTNTLFAEAKSLSKFAIVSGAVFAVTSVGIGHFWGDDI